MPLVKALGEACDGDAGRYVHWGATTQDIVDSALVLQIRDALALIEDDLDAVLRRLAQLSQQFRDTPMAGRSHLQHALPITFGFKCAVWLSAMQRHRRRLETLRGEVLVVQFGGAVGTLASLGEDGIRVLAALAEELDLAVPPIAWHVARDGLAEAACFLGLLTGSLGKIATDIALLMQTEVGEVAEPHAEGRGGSSTMPQKRNPIASEFILAAAKNVRQLVPVMLDAMLQDHERATGPWHAEWLALPQAFALSAGALHHTRALLEGLTVDPARMRRNLDATQGMITAEAVMMALAPRARPRAGASSGRGRLPARRSRAAPICSRCCAPSRASPPICRERSSRRLLDPERYTGLAGAFVDRVVAQQKPQLKEHAMPHAKANGIEIYYELSGPADAPVVMLSNSLGTRLEMWDPQMPALTERYRVLRYDSRGHGRSDAPPGPYSIAMLGEDALRAARCAGHRAACIFAGSRRAAWSASGLGPIMASAC